MAYKFLTRNRNKRKLKVSINRKNNKITICDKQIKDKMSRMVE
jgi:hypothetical protein